MVSATVQWLQCIMHGLNLATEKSCCFERIGPSIRSVSTFCRGVKHTWLVNYMKYVQQPEKMPASVAPSLAQKIRAAHEKLIRSCTFDVCTPTEPDAIGEPLIKLRHGLAHTKVNYHPYKTSTRVGLHRGYARG